MRTKSQRKKGLDNGRSNKGSGKARHYTSKNSKTKYSDAPEVDAVRNDPAGNNDPAWYTNNKQLVLDAGNFSFNTPAGGILSGTYPGTTSKSFSGVMSLTMLMTPGISDDAFSPINIAARSLYDAVNYKNSRNFTYDAPDLMVYTYSIASAYAYWSWMQRIYGTLNTYSQINRYIPDVLVKGMGADPDSIRKSMAQFRYYINLFARKINVFAVPTGMPIFERYMWLFSNVYMDSDNMKASLYVTRPYGFYKFREDLTTGSGAQMVTMPSKTMTLDQIIAYGDAMAEALLSSQDINNMSSDVLKAYENNVLALPDTPAEYGVIAVYNQTVLNQFHNAKALGDFVIDAPSSSESGVSLGSSGNLVQDSTVGHLLYTLELSNNTRYSKLTTTNVLLDTGIENPSPEDVFEMTRLMATTDHETGDVESCGADIITTIDLYYIQDTGSGATVAVYDNSPTYVFLSNSATISGILPTFRFLDCITKFDWAPFVYIVEFNASTSELMDSYIVGDVFNYTSISYTSLKKLHEAAMISMFSLPNTLGSK